MVYIFAAIGVITVTVLLWRMLAAHQAETSARQQPVAPDDDPEFLRKLSEEQNNPRPDED